jgi:LacI family transcriptional regulator
MNGSAPVTMRDIANALGVSAMTVSLALRNHPRIPAEHRAVIHKTAADMGYRQNAMATALVQQRWAGLERPISAELAWINHWREPARLRAYGEFDLYWHGARRAAERCGFRLEEFVVDARLSFARLGKILASRNIQGILVPPHGSAAGSAPRPDSLEWQRFSVVRFGYSIPDFPAHVVSGNHTQGTMLAFAAIRQRGYERIGYVCHWHPSTRSKAGFLMAQTELPGAHRLPILELDMREAGAPETLRQWLQEYRPEAILTEVAELPELLRQLGWRVPEDVALATTSVMDGKVDAGIYQNSEEVGKLAVETLVSLIHQNQTGFPQLGRETLVDACWQDGDSLPNRAGFTVNRSSVRRSLIVG